jgi:F-box domain
VNVDGARFDRERQNKKQMLPDMCNLDDPPAKRTKVQSPDPDAGMVIELPAEIWGHALDYLPFSDVVQCAAVSKQLQESMNFVARISIFKKNELRKVFARRFSNGNVTQVDVFCLITCLDPDEDEEKFSICQSTASRIVPFLVHFPKLLIVGLDTDALGIPLNTYFRDTFLQEDSVEIVRSLVRSICGAYQTGCFCHTVKVYGPAFQAGTLICYYAKGCGLCKMFCESFPLNQAVNARATCISVAERIGAVASRPGGIQCLASKDLVLELLSSNYEVPFKMETSPNVFITENAIVFSKAVMEELEILCRDYFDTKTLTPEMVLDALGSEDADEVWLVRKYHERLTDLGIPVSDSEVLVVDEDKLLSDVHDHI